MQSNRTRLDRFMSRQLGIKRQAIRPILAQGRIRVDGCIATDVQQAIDQFSHVSFDQKILQNKQPNYVMVHKPRGVVCATKDPRHTTLIDILGVDLLGAPETYQLHIAGRLDFNSTGLVLLTNDGRWSRRLCSPTNKIEKCYRVDLEKPINENYINAFSKGMYFKYEDIFTAPVKLKIIGSHSAEVRLIEGRYHQIKRMFGRFQNKVLQLHRLSIGNLALEHTLLPSQSRKLNCKEVTDIF
ncbi:16S rRNA pseudouridine(516) synthase [Gammaproteobacteria bacterium 53_120_T64]|nr:16S rRNA pseudouridine(516) synthase [Gammaproteobacteria bacterium 53_120_T64]